MAHVDVYYAGLYGLGYATTPAAADITRGNFYTRGIAPQLNLDNQLEYRFATGALQHTALAGVDLKYYGIDDRQVLAAARFHSTGRAGMSLLEKVIFVADKIEPGKVRATPALARVRELADRDLDAAILEYLDQMLVVAREEGWPLHPQAVAARNELLLSRRA